VSIDTTNKKPKASAASIDPATIVQVG
jgi:hypothetical protein